MNTNGRLHSMPGLINFFIILDRSSILNSSEKLWKEVYRTTGELLQQDKGKHLCQNIALFYKTCRFHFNLATSGFTNFFPCCGPKDFLYVLITFRNVIEGISQLQDSPR